MRKRMLSLCAALVFCLTLLPIPVFSVEFADAVPWDISDTENASNNMPSLLGSDISMKVGGVDSVSVYITDYESAITPHWSVSNNCVRIISYGENFCNFEALSEGTCTLNYWVQSSHVVYSTLYKSYITKDTRTSYASWVITVGSKASGGDSGDSSGGTNPSSSPQILDTKRVDVGVKFSFNVDDIYTIPSSVNRGASWPHWSVSSGSNCVKVLSKDNKGYCYDLQAVAPGEAIIHCYISYYDKNAAGHTATADFKVIISGDTNTVTFDPNGGIVSKTSKTVTNGKTYGELPTPVRDGYSFDGWYTATEGGDKITESSTFSLNTNQTLYAHWTQTYSVSFSPDSVTMCQGESVTVEVSFTPNLKIHHLNNVNHNKNLLSATWGSVDYQTGKTSITLTGLAPGETTVDISLADKDNNAFYTKGFPVTVTAPVSTTYVVGFHTNGGELAGGDLLVFFDGKTVKNGETYGTLPRAVRSGYAFDGWYTAADGGELITADSIVSLSTNQTLHAHWKKMSTAISAVSRSQNTVTVNVVYAESNATVFCSVYNESGKMLAVRTRAETPAVSFNYATNEATYKFQFGGQEFDYAKVFVCDSNSAPLCEPKRTT